MSSGRADNQENAAFAEEMKLTESLERDFDQIKEQLMEDVSMVGNIQVQSSPEDQIGLLLFSDFCRINMLLKKYSHPMMVPTLKYLIDERRMTFQRGEDEELYRDLALKFTKFEESFTERISDYVLE